MKITYPKKINLKVRAVEILRKGGMSDKDIGGAFDRSKQMIWMIRNKSPKKIRIKLTKEAKRDFIIEHLPKKLVERIEKIRFAGRDQFEVQMRSEIVGELREKYGLSFPNIGLIINRDHASCIHLFYKIYKKSK